MRFLFLFVWSLSVATTVISQPGGGNKKKPKITGQKPISTSEEQPVVIQMTDLEVRDRDHLFYPWGFTMKLYEGANYTLSNQNTVVPVLNFVGELAVPVTVNDGNSDSDPFTLKIQVRPVNDSPVVTGQAVVSTNEDQAFTLLQGHLTITDPDDTQFTLSVSGGQNYTVANQIITPSPNFFGTLTIPVQINDGEANSAVFNFQLPVVAVNDPPKITGQVGIEAEAGKPVTLLLSQLTVTDPDNAYPNGFTLAVQASADGRYVASGNQITPSASFEGMLPVMVTVNDGKNNSEPFAMQIKVNPSKNGPVITGQNPVTIQEDERLTILFSHLTVSDPDTPYPTGFTLKILPGTNYSFTGNTIMPAADYNSNLTVNVVVNDGTRDSNTYGLLIAIHPVNDAPRILNLEVAPLTYQVGKGEIIISESIDVADPDNDSLTQVEVSIRPETYRPGIDELLFASGALIKGTFDRTLGVLKLAGRAPIADYVKAMRSVKYVFGTEMLLPFETKFISFMANDGKLSGEKAERQIKSKDIIVNLDIPTAFTPNGDSANDTWSIRALQPSEELATAVVRIYNRKGLLLYEAEGFDGEWDGKLNGEFLPADTYFYTIDLNLEYSTTVFKGLVTILR
jgi:gliding motility-associated-like protein